MKRLLARLRAQSDDAWLATSLLLAGLASLALVIPWPPLATLGGLLLLTLLPGSQLTRWLGLWRGWFDLPSLGLSVALGLVISPLLLFWSGWLVNLSWGVTLLTSLSFILVMAGLNQRQPSPTTLSPRMPVDRFLAVVLGLLAGAIILAYTQAESELGSYPIRMGDWVKHHGVAWALRHTGIPPANVFFAGPAPDDSMTYYYFLHLTTASLDRLRGGPSDIHGAFVIMAVVASLSFAALFYWLAQTLFQDRRAARAALLFGTFIGGLDIIPILRRAALKQPDVSWLARLVWPVEHIDNWTPTQQLRLSTFVTHYLWVPQHVTGLLIIGLGLYLYYHVPNRRRLLPVLSLLLAALLGHSTWIALIIGLVLPLFGLYQIGRAWRQSGGDRRATLALAAGYVLVAVGALLVALPLALTLLRSGPGQAGIVFEIPHQMSNWPLLAPFSSRWPGQTLAQLLDVPLHYLVEMGALLVAGLLGWLWFWRQRPAEPLLPFWSLVLLIGFGTITFFAAGRSHAELGLILNNDLGLRAIMPAQMGLALFGGYALARISRRRRWLLLILVPLIGLGLASSLWEVLAMGVSKYHRPPEVPRNILQAFAAMPEVTPLGAVVQHRTHDDFSRVQPDYAGRFNGYSTSEAISVGMSEPRKLALAIELAQQAFANRLPLRSYQQFLALGADYVFVGPVEQRTEFYPDKFGADFYFRPVYDRDDVSIVAIKPRLTDTPQASFDQQAIEFRGYFIDPVPHYPGQPAEAGLVAGGPGLVTAWRLTRPVDQDYTAFIHLVDSSGQIVAQADHQLWAWDVREEGPTSRWTPELTHLDLVALPAAALASGQPLSLRLGLWLPETGQQFPVETTELEVDGAGRLVIGEMGLP